jgi:hypothetical protein
MAKGLFYSVLAFRKGVVMSMNEAGIYLTRDELDSVIEGLDAYFDGNPAVIEIWEKLCLIQADLDKDKIKPETIKYFVKMIEMAPNENRKMYDYVFVSGSLISAELDAVSLAKTMALHWQSDCQWGIYTGEPGKIVPSMVQVKVGIERYDQVKLGRNRWLPECETELP